MLARQRKGYVVSRLTRGQGEVVFNSPTHQRGRVSSPTRQQGRVAVHLGRALLARLRGGLICAFACCLGFVVSAGVSAAADLVEATTQFRTGKYAECIEQATELVTQNDYHEPAWVLKIQAEMTVGRYADAAKSLDAALAKLNGSVQLRWLGRDVCRHTQQLERADKFNAEIVGLLQQAPWRYSDLTSQLVIGRWMLSQQTDPKQVLTKIYNEAKRRQPTNVDVWLAIGDLALDKHDYKLAGDSFQQGVKLDAENPAAHFGVARAFAPSDSKKADAALQATLALNPRHVAALLMVADEQIDSEQYDEAEKQLLQVLTINPQQPRALAYRAVIAHLRNKLDQEKQLRAAALKSWPANPEVDYVIGQKLSQKYRFAEGSAYQRQALKSDPKYLVAKIQLAQDLLRLGQEEEGLKLAEEVYAADGYNVLAHNLVTLQEHLAKFRTLEADGLQVRMDAREADIYGQRVLALLQRAKKELCEKYKVTLEQPIIVEMFPKQQDFAIRTFGMPGGSGFLGVCFGTVITAPSPASQGTSPACWEATLWHEFCHVVTLTKTKNKMPRWLSEGISVYEEGAEDPTWGQAITPRYREMLLGDELTPVSKLSGAFLSPASPAHLQFAYLESSLVVKFFLEKYGRDKLERLLVDLSVGMPINESLGRYTGSIATLDDEFAKYAREQAKAMAPLADWTEPELPKRATADEISTWLKDHPTNYIALGRLAAQQLQAKDWPAAQATLTKMTQLYPHDASPGGPYALLARIHREAKDAKQERAVLEKLAALSASDLDMLTRLNELAAAAKDWEPAKKYALRALAVNPLLPAIHRQAATAAEQLNDQRLVADSYRALLLLDPFDRAELHFKLATALQKQGQLAAAKREALLALEETPRYQAAQNLLLELVAAVPTPPLPADKPASASQSDLPAAPEKTP
ncbi:Tetratricopeptide repeat protein [Anatilimnocola aggregata]|uniref:Tetratricopeptide repeat protein n=1 Tax=Anatilimnocola aggregata TaxID=2528021 RepID=A0A517YG64_9BACT|nr:peptidase MA family metallohydrolase [Anatilimnocola aggregata]QDU29182.1 Tetratricopeptide repeat protein [Anatilimnocola aggregata]